MAGHTYVSDIARFEGQTVTLKGWLYAKRSSGKLHFLQVRDGTGTIQCVVSRADVTPEVFELVSVKYNQYGFWAIFSAGFTPIPYKVFTIAAGVFEVNLGVFLLASALGRSARFLLIGVLVWKFGSPIKAFVEQYFNLLSVAFVVVLLLGFAVIKLAL